MNGNSIKSIVTRFGPIMAYNQHSVSTASNAGIEVNKALSTDGASKYTILAWVKTSSVSSTQYIADFRFGTEAIKRLYLNGSALAGKGMSQRLNNSTTAIAPTNTWFHVAGPFDANADPIDKFRIGVDNSAGNGFLGKIDEVVLLNKQLTAVEITEAYNNGVVTDPMLYSFSTNIIAHLRMGDLDDNSTLIKNRVGSSDFDGVPVGAGSISISDDSP